MLTRVGLGVLIALALDPIVGSIERRWHLRRGFAVAIVAVAVGGVAALLVGVLGPQAVEQARSFSRQLPETIDQLESLPARRGVHPREPGRRAGPGVGAPAARAVHRRAHRRAGRRARQRHRQRRDRGDRDASPCLSTDENLLERATPAAPPGTARPGRRGRRRDVPHARALLRRLDHRRRADGPLRAGARACCSGIPLVPLAALWAMLTDLIPQVGGFLGGSFFVLLALDAGRRPTALDRRRRLRAVHEPREPRHPAGDRRPVGRPDPADDDGRRVRRRRRRSASPAPWWRRRSSARPRPSTWRPGRDRPRAGVRGGGCSSRSATGRSTAQGVSDRSSLHCDTRSAQIAQSVEQRTRNA